MYSIVNYTDCTPQQLRDILVLRNLPEVRRWMVGTEPIAEQDHFRFVESLRGNGRRLYYAVYRDGVLVGTWNLTDEGDGVWERGIIASPATQGKGETAVWEKQIIDSLPDSIKALSAKVRRDNARSLRYHDKMGFRQVRTEDEFIYSVLVIK